MSDRNIKLLSVLLPCYNEENQLPLTIKTLQEILEDLRVKNYFQEYEIIFVDDGSTDQSWAVLSEHAANNSSIKALRLSRNFGKESAWLAGINNVHGDCAILLDCDLQHPPRYFATMIDLWREGYDVVEGVKSSRGKESFLSRLNAQSFYSLFKRYTGLDLHNASDFKLLDRKVLDQWQYLGEQNTFFRGMSAWVGFKRTSFEFEVADRKIGNSRWSLFSLLRLSMNAITGFSAKPLMISAFIGCFLLLLFFILGIQTLVHWFSGTAIEGFTTVILLQLLIGGAITISIALTGIYIAQIYNEVKGRPRYIIMDSEGYTEAIKPDKSK